MPFLQQRQGVDGIIRLGQTELYCRDSKSRLLVDSRLNHIHSVEGMRQTLARLMRALRAHHKPKLVDKAHSLA